MSLSAPRRIVVGISGATGIVLGVRLLEVLRSLEVETHLVVSGPAEITRQHETDVSSAELRALASRAYKITDIGAAIASGSFKTMGMIVAPCSARTLADIAYGTTGNLLTRAADVALKERRRLALLVREAPLSLVHLRAMTAATEAGAIVVPPVPAFYTRPQTIDEVVDHIVGRTLDLFDLESDLVSRWDGIERAEPNGHGKGD
ncbi:MAG: UbiX family flavin prenyltransferase [Sandaracinaceae bacterium]